MVEIYGMEKEILKNLANSVKNRSWDIYKRSKEFIVPTPEEVINKILVLSQAEGWLACMLAITFLTGSRIKEILRYEYVGTYKEDVLRITGKPIVKPGFMPINMQYYKDEDGELYLVFKTRNEKQNSKAGKDKINIRHRIELLKRDNYKELRIPCDEAFIDFKLIKLVDDFFDMQNFYLEDYEKEIENMKPKSFFIPFKKDLLNKEIFAGLQIKTSSRRLRKYFGMSHHNFREIRMKQLRSYYNFDVAELKIAGGWKSADMPLRYASADQESIIKRFKEYKYNLRQEDLL